jgi:uncharacterized protein (DUF2147 family)
MERLMHHAPLRACAALGAAMALSATLALAAGADDLAETTWATDGGGAHVRFADEDGALVGRIVWLAGDAETGEATLDAANPDETLRTRPLNGVAMVWGFTQTRDNVWDRGRIYAPDEGKTYNAKMTLEGDMLTLTGCIRWPLCRDTAWTRVEGVTTSAAEE